MSWHGSKRGTASLDSPFVEVNLVWAQCILPGLIGCARDKPAMTELFLSTDIRLPDGSRQHMFLPELRENIMSANPA